METYISKTEQRRIRAHHNRMNTAVGSVLRDWFTNEKHPSDAHEAGGFVNNAIWAFGAGDMDQAAEYLRLAALYMNRVVGWETAETRQAAQVIAWTPIADGAWTWTDDRYHVWEVFRQDTGHWHIRCGGRLVGETDVDDSIDALKFACDIVRTFDYDADAPDDEDPSLDDHGAPDSDVFGYE